MSTDPNPHPVWRVLITGSRTWTDASTITRALDDLHARHGAGLRIVHGACPHGADAIAQAWAQQHGVPVETHPADWSTGRGAGPTRNAAMVATSPDQCLAFIAEHSRGATGTADRAQAAGIPTTRHTAPTPTAHAAVGAPVRREGELVHQDGGQLVAVVDGPLAGQWFTWPDWQARLDAAHYMEQRTGRRSPVLDYAPGGYRIDNPVLEHTHGWAAVHHPTPIAADQDGGTQRDRHPDRADIHTPTPPADDADADVHDDADDDEHADVFDLAG